MLWPGTICFDINLRSRKTHSVHRKRVRERSVQICSKVLSKKSLEIFICTLDPHSQGNTASVCVA